MSFISNEFNKIVRNAITRYSQQKSLLPENVQLLFCLNPAAEYSVRYWMCNDYKRVEEQTIKQVLDIRTIDLRGYSVMLPPQIQKILFALCEQREIEPDAISVICTLSESVISMWLYSGHKFIAELPQEEIFSPVEIE